MQIILKDLPKISLNQWYSGNHWSERKQIKDAYKTIVKAQFKQQFKKDKVYHTNYLFGFKKRPLDASNCIAMVKLIEDIIFEDDKHDIVKSITVESRKAEVDFVKIEVIIL